jgi:hypothetical protein
MEFYIGTDCSVEQQISRKEETQCVMKNLTSQFLAML